MKNNIKTPFKKVLESFYFWSKIIPKIILMIKTIIKIYVIYTPIMIFWLMFIGVDFNGALFIEDFQKLNKETVFNIYFLVNMMTLMYFAFLIVFPKKYGEVNAMHTKTSTPSINPQKKEI